MNFEHPAVSRHNKNRQLPVAARGCLFAVFAFRPCHVEFPTENCYTFNNDVLN